MVTLSDESPALYAVRVSKGKWKMARHLMRLDEALVRASYEPDQRVIVQMPPRHGKSSLGSIYFPSWYRRKFLDRNIMMWSATSALASKFSNNVRATCRLPLDDRIHAWERWKVEGTPPDEAEFYAAGIGSGATMGSGFHLGIIDDYHRHLDDALSETIRRKQQQWYLTAGPNTRAEPGASIIVIATRWHRHDLIGFILEQAKQTGEKWQVISMPAIGTDGAALWPERWPKEELLKRKRSFEKSGYPWMWEALYQQKPPETIDTIWDPAYFGDHVMFDHDVPKDQILMKMLVLDPSVGHHKKTDYSAIVHLTVTKNGHLWVEADLDRRDVSKQIDALLQWSREKDTPLIGVEYQGFAAVLKELFFKRCQELNYLPLIKGIATQQDKRLRINALITPYLSRGYIHFRDNSPSISLLLEQLRGFPSHQYDDGPDALAMSIQLAQHVAENGIGGDLLGSAEVISA